MTSVTKLLMVALFCAACPARAQSFDVLIRGGRVLDGSGNPWFYADVGIRDGEIISVGQLGDAQAARVVDARGLTVVPGFIDLPAIAPRTK